MANLIYKRQDEEGTTTTDQPVVVVFQLRFVIIGDIFVHLSLGVDKPAKEIKDQRGKRNGGIVDLIDGGGGWDYSKNLLRKPEVGREKNTLTQRATDTQHAGGGNHLHTAL